MNKWLTLRKLKYEKECLENYDKLKTNNMMYKELMKELLDHEYKYEVTLQNISYLEKELNAIRNNYKEKLNEVEQKAGLRVSFVSSFLRILY